MIDAPCCAEFHRPRALGRASKPARAPAPHWMADVERCCANPFRERTVCPGPAVGPTASRHWSVDRLRCRCLCRDPCSCRADWKIHRHLADAEHCAKPWAGSPVCECCWSGSHPGSEYCQLDAARLSYPTQRLGFDPSSDFGSRLLPALDCGLGFDSDPGFDFCPGSDFGRSLGFDPGSG